MSNKATKEERDFAIVMQQLSAEAEKILPGDQSNSLPEVRDPTEPGQQPDAFFERLHGLENSVLNRLEQIAAQVEASRAAAFAKQFRRIDDGYPESSPVGAFPLGASPFGIEDMA